ncbi:Hypothetical protein R9X50_00085600 [Acrodontium crateriforme]|uniref:SAP domain-containing protein n=1 Tax=Acrodontium crateriforme TaxID=150365 RepID=A0AAQ3R2B4_9PEZI|nr:Hypothetical protein R9X50_00085600 [Acrodontium crateriforme]
MSDYGKKKNDELQALCKERGLSHAGKKADLVKRLEDHDAQGASAAVPAPKAAIEDEIDWDEDDTAKPATTEPAKAAVAAGGVDEVATPAAVPNQKTAVDPSTTNELKASVPATESAPANGAAEEPKKPEKDYTAGDAERTLDAEIEKRKARARRFGLPEDSEEIKKLERAKKFGTADLPGLLNKALPADLGRKRGADNAEEGDRKRSRGPKGRGGKDGAADAPKKNEGKKNEGKKNEGKKNEGKKTEGEKKKNNNNGYASWMTEDDKRKADARKAKFAPAPATS